MLDWNRRGGNPHQAFCPRFPRPKNEGWLLTLGEVDRGELVALKRIHGTLNKSTQLLVFSTPPNRG